MNSVSISQSSSHPTNGKEDLKETGLSSSRTVPEKEFLDGQPSPGNEHSRKTAASSSSSSSSSITIPASSVVCNKMNVMKTAASSSTVPASSDATKMNVVSSRQYSSHQPSPGTAHIMKTAASSSSTVHASSVVASSSQSSSHEERKKRKRDVEKKNRRCEEEEKKKGRKKEHTKEDYLSKADLSSSSTIVPSSSVPDKMNSVLSSQSSSHPTNGKEDLKEAGLSSSRTVPEKEFLDGQLYINRQMIPGKTSIMQDLYKSATTMIRDPGTTRNEMKSVDTLPEEEVAASPTESEEYLVVGDSVQYYHPMMIWGLPQNLRCATILDIWKSKEIDDYGEYEYKVTLSDHVVLDGDKRVRKSSRWRYIQDYKCIIPSVE
jgi:hypothetical protein